MPKNFIASPIYAGGGHDLPDLALYDGNGDYLVVAGEVKLPSEDIKTSAFSEERNDQIGRYLAQTGVVLVSNVRGFGLLTVHRDASRTAKRIVPEYRQFCPRAGFVRCTALHTHLCGNLGPPSSCCDGAGFMNRPCHRFCAVNTLSQLNRSYGYDGVSAIRCSDDYCVYLSIGYSAEFPALR